MRKSAANIVRAVALLTNKPYTVFNDARSFGRSIKVWGWDQADYDAAIFYLQKAGYDVRMVRTPKLRYSWSTGNSLRIWVKEV